MPSESASKLLPSTEWDKQVPGLHLRRQATRSTWCLFYRLDGRQRRQKIGDARVVSRAEARKKALQWLALISQGIDPVGHSERRTMADLKARFDEVHAPRKKPTTQEEYRRLWKLYVLPAMGHLDVTKVTRAHVNDLHHAMRGRPYQANRTIAMLHKAFNLAKAWGWLEGENPAKVERYAEHKRRRVPSTEEAQRLLAAVDTMRAEQPWFAGMVELLVFTGCRLREVMDARWDWVRDGGLHLPDSKTGAKVVPLNEPARQVLARMPRIVGNPHIICGTGRGPLKGHFKHWRRLLQLAEIEDLRIHDLRRFFVSVSLSAGVPLDQIGQVVGHASIVTTRGYAYLAQDAAKRAAELAGDQLRAIRLRSTPAS